MTHTLSWFWAEVKGNLLAIPPCGALGYAWAKTKFWPLRPLRRVLAHSRHHTQLLEELHHLAHVGEEHPRVKARRAAGEHPTPHHKETQ